MRAIKFRAFEKVLKIMLPVNEIYFYEGKVWMVKLPTQVNRTDNSYIELMQFTGLLDKNGKEIYEGDIVRMPYNQVQEVKFGDGKMGQAGHGDYATYLWSGFNLSGHGDFKVSDIEVIGNIYSNPDLL